MSLRLAPLSNTERQSVIASLAAGVRLDGRGLLENREVSVQFGQSYGSCTVSLGETRVLAQVRILEFLQRCTIDGLLSRVV